VGSLIPALYFLNYTVDKREDDRLNGYAIGKKNMSDVLWMESIMTLITMVPNILLFRDHPPTLPSLGSVNKQKITVE
jgi:hypothetical protein